LWIVEDNFVVWVQLEVVADFEFGARLMFIHLADVKRYAITIESVCIARCF